MKGLGKQYGIFTCFIIFTQCYLYGPNLTMSGKSYGFISKFFTLRGSASAIARSVVMVLNSLGCCATKDKRYTGDGGVLGFICVQVGIASIIPCLAREKRIVRKAESTPLLSVPE